MRNSLTILIAFIAVIACLVLYASLRTNANIARIEYKVEEAEKEAARKDRTIDLQDSILRQTRNEMNRHRERINDLEKVIYAKDSLILQQRQKIYSQNKKINEFKNFTPIKIPYPISPIPHSDLEKRYKPKR